eukprot:TRINITY_DN24642_c0_g1_i1.p1 TRINITY_DN24642_c0_g1~~TRINITY_DN24642_c0_g1_i1.p1  ORF type:complete len:470 (+),score=183.55 TRINITY_DN24642_c0_g1_i1:66-1475(+)
MNTSVEVIRQVHEGVERNIEEMVVELPHEPKSHRQRLYREHFISERLDQIQAKRRRLVGYYKERAGVKEEPLPLSTVETNFYAELANIQEYHAKFPGVLAEQPEMETPDPDQCKVQFSGEEGFGKYLDLHAVYEKFMRLPFNYDSSNVRDGGNGYTALLTVKVRPIDYVNWLRRCTMFHVLPKQTKNQEYKEYVDALYTYLKGFYDRTQPLSMGSAEIIEEGTTNFEERWAEGGVMGWEDSAERMKAVGGGAGEGGKKKKLSKGQRVLVFQKSVALLEELSQRFYDMLEETVTRTLTMLERKETRSKEELDAEVAREEQEARDAYEERYIHSKDADKEPAEKEFKDKTQSFVGPDGEPMPYWLWRLHGLKRKFTCEICRGYQYVGMKAYDQHFQEPRHAAGMRCLGIPNTKHFHHVPNINDALALWEKLKGEVSAKTWSADNDQEFEDAQGHVFNKKTRDDMRRQGLLA